MKHNSNKLPLKTILINFLNHVESLENQRTPDNTYESEFQELKLFSESIKGKKLYSCSEGEKEVNRKKNRYKDILPFDTSRVVLAEYAGVPGSDYINANYIKGASGSPAYIASQGPLPNTVNDFWRMVVQCEVQVIVMACNEEEAGKHKCENYWVEGEGEEKQFGMVSLRLIKASTVCPDFSVRTMRIKYLNSQSNTEERTVCQFHYSAWPDHGVPPLVKPLLDMVRLVRDTQASETLPVLIHCSAGCGRTGTICAIDYVWGLLRAGKLTKDFSLLVLVREMRRQRIAMVQTKEQYVLVHQAVRELFREQLRMIDSHPYENIDCNGLPLVKCPSPEPFYDTIPPFQNNNVDEKQDEVEKELAPPLPQKKRFHTLSSKQAKEVENLTERQRLAERAGSSSESVASTGSSGQKPRIATLRSLFERQHATRDSRQVSRSHSTGSVRPHHSRPPAQPQPQPQPKPQPQPPSSVEMNEKPIPGRGILRVPKPALPVKRSKSMRVLGSSDRNKLSIPPRPPCDIPADVVDAPLTSQHRRRSLESNFSEMKDLAEADSQQNLSDFLSVDSIVAGLGVRERRNSFRRAVRSEAEDALALKPKKPGLLRSYTSVDMRSTVDRSKVTFDPPKKPFLHPKPSLQTKLNRKDDKRDLSYRNSNQTLQFSALSELKKQQLQSPSSHHLMSHSLSLRIAPRVKKEDCRVLLSPPTAKSTMSYPSEPLYSSGESTKSGASSDHSLPKTSYPKSSRVPKQHSSKMNEVYDFDRHNKQNVKSTSQYQHNPRNPEETTPNIYTHQKLSDSVQPSKPEQTSQQMHPKMSPVGDIRKHPPMQNTQSGLQDPRTLKPGSNPIYGTTSKASPPPYVEPGKTARKPKSSQQPPSSSKQTTKGFTYEEIYGKSQEQKDWKMCIPPELLCTSNHNSKDSQSPYGPIYSKSILERRHTEQNIRHHTQEIYSRAADYDRSSHPGVQSSQDQRSLKEQEVFISKERANLDQEPHQRTSHPGIAGKASDRRFLEQTMSSTDFYYSTTVEASRNPEQNNHPGVENNASKPVGDRRDEAAEGIYVRRKTENVQGRRLEEAQRNTRGVGADVDLKYKNRPINSDQAVPSASRPYQECDTPLSHASGGVRMRRGSRDDLALCATTPSRVKRHASVVLLRHSLIEGADTPAASALTVWGQANAGNSSSTQNTPSQSKEDPWSGAVGVDLDQVAASITVKKDGKLIRAALEALHLRKASTPRKPAKTSSPVVKPSPAQSSPSGSHHSTPSAQFKPPPSGSHRSSPPTHYNLQTSASHHLTPSTQYNPQTSGSHQSTPSTQYNPQTSGGSHQSTPSTQYNPQTSGGSHQSTPSTHYNPQTSGSHHSTPSAQYNPQSSGSHHSTPSTQYNPQTSGSHHSTPSTQYNPQSSGSHHSTPSTQYNPQSSGSHHSTPSTQYNPQSSGSHHSTPSTQYKPPPGPGSGAQHPAPTAQYKPSDPPKPGVRQQYL